MTIDELGAKAGEIAEIFGYEFDPTAEPLNSEHEVQAVERALGVSLPLSYRAFLIHFNELLPINGELLLMAGLRSISGMKYVRPGSETNPNDALESWASDLVEENLRLRDRPAWLAKTKAGDEWWDQQPKWPNSLIEVVSSDDSNYFLDLSRMDATGECPVSVLPPEPAGETVAASFLEFLRKYRSSAR
mgnify:CR=1 FL=1